MELLFEIRCGSYTLSLSSHPFSAFSSPDILLSEALQYFGRQIYIFSFYTVNSSASPASWNLRCSLEYVAVFFNNVCSIMLLYCVFLPYDITTGHMKCCAIEDLSFILYFSIWYTTLHVCVTLCCSLSDNCKGWLAFEALTTSRFHIKLKHLVYLFDTKIPMIRNPLFFAWACLYSQFGMLSNQHQWQLDM